MSIITQTSDVLTFEPDSLLRGAAKLETASALPASVGYETTVHGDGIEYRFAKGTLCGFNWLSADFLLEGKHTAVLALKLLESETNVEFVLIFGMLNQCQARLRLPLTAVKQNVWMLGREGACLKRACFGQRVDLAKVDGMRLCLERYPQTASRWAMTTMTATRAEPELLSNPILPAGPLLDAIGQSTLHQWPGKTPSGVVLHARLTEQAGQASTAKWPQEFSRFGGWNDHRFDATGFFRTQHDGKRWWLVDPDGFAFFSSGQDCVQMSIDANVTNLHKAAQWLPPTQGLFAPAWHPNQSVDFLVSNFIRVFGADYRRQWGQIAMSLLKQVGFNTLGNWSDWRMGKEAGFPYVRPMEFVPKQTQRVYRDFPDVFASTMVEDAREYARQLEETAADPAMVGYFLMNEPEWGFAADTPAEGMLFNTPSCRTREALADYLQKLHGTQEKLSSAWGMDVSFDTIRSGLWQTPMTLAARADLTAFSTVMVERYYTILTAACKQIDPNHLNLGARYYTVPPQWALLGMKSFDVFSINCYRPSVPAEQLDLIASLTGRPTLIGEWHFGALDVGLPASGIGFVATQADRGRAYRVYLENAAALSNCVGVHYFTMYDQSALGRFDGENYNIGFVDVCHRPYEELCAAALLSHRRMYAVAAGQEKPFGDAPTYLPPLFM